MEIDEAPYRTLVAIRQQISQDKWENFADGIAKDRQLLQSHLRLEMPLDNLRLLLPALKQEAYATLPIRFSAIPEIKNYLEKFPVYKGPHPHIFPDNKPQPIEQASAEFPIVCYRWQDVVRAPGLMDQLNDPRLIDLIESYLGCVPTLYGVNAFWSFPTDEPKLFYQQHFHRDTDDWRFLALFIYLTDVDDGSGPHQVVPGSASLEGTIALTKGPTWNPFSERHKANRQAQAFARRSFSESIGGEFSDLCNRYMADKAVSVTGPAGTMFLVNTLALHRGLMPKKKPRLMVWARYGLSAPAALPSPVPVADESGAVPFSFPDTPRNRYINRLIFDFDRN